MYLTKTLGDVNEINLKINRSYASYINGTKSLMYNWIMPQDS